MSQFFTSHIQGDLTISPSSTDQGIFHTNLMEETTLNQGININSSDLNIKNKIKFKNNGILTTDFNLDNLNLFNITNNAGGISILSSSTRGILIDQANGNVTVTSTTDSIDEFTGSLITNGGAVIGKTLNVKEDINSLDGVSSFTNTNSNQGVLEIKNTNNNGTSSISFKNTGGQNKLELGWGNSGAVLPLNDTAYIQSVNGSELFLRADSQDSVKISTNGSLDFYSTLSSSSITSGALRLLGGISISNISDAVSVASGGSFTTSGGMSISKRLYLGDTLNIESIPSPPSPASGVSRIYFDDIDNKLKSKNSSGSVTVYQPTTTKGDLATYNGTTQVRLPVGTDGYILKADSSSVTGLKWDIGGGVATGSSTSNKFNLHSTGVYTTLTEEASGAFINFIYPKIDNGASGIFTYSKSNVTLNGVTNRFNSNTSLISLQNLISDYPSYSGFKITKNYTEGNGDYIENSNSDISRQEVTLTGTNWSIINPIGFGCFSYSLDGGSCCTFIICKTRSLDSGANISTFSSSPSISNGSLRLRWNSLSGIELRKTTNGEDGIYYIKDNFLGSLSIEIQLTGTQKTTISSSIFNYYQNKSFMFKISSLENYPNGVFWVSKNRTSRVGSISRFRSPGVGSNELLTVNWDQNKGLEISKNGLNYDGLYTILFTKLT